MRDTRMLVHPKTACLHESKRCSFFLIASVKEETVNFTVLSLPLATKHEQNLISQNTANLYEFNTTVRSVRS